MKPIIHDKEYKKCINTMNKFNDYTVKCGFPFGKEQTNKVVNKFTILVLAVLHEFGAIKKSKSGEQIIKERSFIRKSFDVDREKIESFVKEIYNQIIDNKITLHNGLKLLGLFGVNSIKRFFPKILPDIKQSTKDRKKSSKILIDKGQLINAISFAITKGE
jgi:hypothetical protein